MIEPAVISYDEWRVFSNKNKGERFVLVEDTMLCFYVNHAASRPIEFRWRVYIASKYETEYYLDLGGRLVNVSQEDFISFMRDSYPQQLEWILWNQDVLR